MGTYRDQNEEEMKSGEEKGLGIYGINIGIIRFTIEFALPTFSCQIVHYLHLSWQSFLPCYWLGEMHT